MTITEIKEAALTCGVLNQQELSKKIRELKDSGISYLGCFTFTQHNQQISTLEAKNLTLKLDAFTEKEKAEYNGYHNLMMDEFKEED
ncbi:hypothetical protein H5J24_03880 [Chryseobacterium capnotolerans]|uniref:hypothetical protein n=1 Tax=Chryseobacterium TaxID=59732 RepID=UPI00083A1AAA|nr:MULTISPECIES: hypothetical protein [Chryseobacterium]UHO39270.1 hypothetical protein H5J24_03880 [Chryseobacterium capnotolerans]